MKYFGITDIGLVRDENQDSFFCIENKHKELFAVVCDGIGGGKAGGIASEIATNVLYNEFMSKGKYRKEMEQRKWIVDAIEKANEQVYLDSLSSNKKHGMGTTLVGVLIASGITYIFHMGDSRVYGLYDEMICLTEDHNLAADLIKTGECEEKEALRHPKAKALTNALGIWHQYKVEINKVKKGYQALLICSDGLHGYVSENIIESILFENIDVKRKTERLLEAATTSGGFDNVSIIVIEKDGGK